MMIKNQPLMNYENCSASSQVEADGNAVSSRVDTSVGNESNHLVMRRVSSEKIIKENKRFSFPEKNIREFNVKNSQKISEMTSFDKQTLAENLLQHLKTGSTDSLNIMRSVFEYNRYDTKLLEKFIKDKSPDNLKALTTQIKLNLFVTFGVR